MAHLHEVAEVAARGNEEGALEQVLGPLHFGNGVVATVTVVSIQRILAELGVLRVKSTAVAANTVAARTGTGTGRVGRGLDLLEDTSTLVGDGSRRDGGGPGLERESRLGRAEEDDGRARGGNGNSLGDDDDTRRLHDVLVDEVGGPGSMVGDDLDNSAGDHDRSRRGQGSQAAGNQSREAHDDLSNVMRRTKAEG